MSKRNYNDYTYGLQKGIIKRKEKCENCESTENIEGHHIDYNQPLFVFWLCRICHSKLFRRDGTEKKHFLGQCEEFKERTSFNLSIEEKENLYKKLLIDKYRKVSAYDQCLEAEKKILKIIEGIQVRLYELSGFFRCSPFIIKEYAEWERQTHRDLMEYNNELRRKYPEKHEQIY